MKQAVFDTVVVGAGVVGLWTGLELAARGARVAVLERRWPGAGTSGRFHALLHSGGRYAVRDPVSARECIEENRVLRRVAPHAVRATGGYFVATSREEERFYETWAEAAREAGIPVSEVPVGEARREEPLLTPAARLVAEVPDGVVNALAMHASLALTMWLRGAALLAPLEVTAIQARGTVLHVEARDAWTRERLVIETRAVVNAAGPWAPRVAALAGHRLGMNPVAGSLVTYPGVQVTRVLNRLRPPSDGDILVPYGGTVLAGTTAYPAPGPEVEPQRWEIELIAREASVLVPRLRSLEPLHAFASVRPLAEKGGGREASRSFKIVTHSRDPVFISITGGKYTTARLVAEHAADAAAGLMGLPVGSATRSMVLRGGDPLEELRGLSPRRASALEAAWRGMDREGARAAAYHAIIEEVVEGSRRLLGL